MPQVKLCNLDELNDIDSRGFVLPKDDLEHDIFIVRNYNEIVGYKNSCPHNFAPLNWSSDIFLDQEQNYIQCVNHGALFEIHDGTCIYGPCIGRSLSPIEIKIENNIIYACI